MKIFRKLLLFSSFLLLTSCQSKLDKFAMCLTDAGAVMYGSDFCQTCKEQKEFFGESAKYLNFVECDKEAKDNQSKECEFVKINSYPTWMFGEGNYLVGKQTFKALSDKTGCAVPL